MKITNEMVDMYLQGDLVTAIEILGDLANGEYTVENWRTDLEVAYRTQETEDKGAK